MLQIGHDIGYWGGVDDKGLGSGTRGRLVGRGFNLDGSGLHRRLRSKDRAARMMLIVYALENTEPGWPKLSMTQ